MRRIEYVRVLDIMSLLGRKDCEIFYIKHTGDYKELVKMAYERNIVITSISRREYENMERKIKFAEDVVDDKTIYELIGRPSFQ